MDIESIPHPVMGITRDHCRYIGTLLTPYLVTTTVGDLTYNMNTISVFWAYDGYFGSTALNRFGV